MLIVDDAVDSGNTMLDVFDFISGINDSCDVKTAVLTTTFTNPIHNADFTLYSKIIIKMSNGLWMQDKWYQFMT
ncbi:hypothetical protein [Moritella marina]|uniref:hypothetical protein n=1 Tax=Moritella marina TaxID=90736 RepID=UPI003704CC24